MISGPTKPTLREVAAHARVSVTTVSAVINGRGIVSPERTRRVREAMAALDYHPDQLARSLKTGRSDVIGVIVPDITSAFYPDVVRGIEEAAFAKRISVMLCDAAESFELEQRHLATLASRRVDGVLIACSGSSEDYANMRPAKLPLVFFDRVPSGPISSVSTDDKDAGRMATAHLVELGHQRIALLAGPVHHSTHAARLVGYLGEMRRNGLAPPEGYVPSGDQTLDQAYESTRGLLFRSDRPTAIIATNPYMLLGAIRALAETGLRCPQDISIIGFDDRDWARSLHPALTMIDQTPREMGRLAFTMLLDRMHGSDQGRSERAMHLPPQLIIRQSTAPPGG